LAGEQRPGLDNAASRALRRLTSIFHERDPERFGEFLHPEVVMVDRRRGPTAPPQVGRAAHVANFEATLDVGMTRHEFEPVAVRGERLVLARGGARTDAGLESSALVLYEFDDGGRLERTDLFSEGDLALALEELDNRYAVGEGADHAHVARAV